VRDCDGGIAQFLYGEDGIDPVKQLGLKWLPLMADNTRSVAKGIQFDVLAHMNRKRYREAKKTREDAMKESGER
jgi:hypothetical protein